jgi:phosphoglycolate phosphatase-like HAD superfamily hydrolase
MEMVMRVCLFDIDGTLLNSMGAGKAALESALLEEFGLPAIRERVSYSGRTDRAIMRDLMQLHDIELSPGHVERLTTGYLRRLPESLHRHQGRVLPGIARLLQDLSQRPDMAVGLLTGNIRAGARVKLGHFGLYDYFGFGGFGDHHWERDDVACEALTVVRKNLGNHVALEDIVVVGDTPLDVQCARAIGVKAVAVATGWHTLEQLQPCQPDLLLQDLADPAPLLALWQ